MQSRGGDSTFLRLRKMFFIVLLLASCAHSVPQVVQLPSPPPLPVFPPEAVMKDGNYAAFLAENEEVLQQCGKGVRCEVALFNLGFVYAYAQSPYRDLALALWYFDELVKKYPDTPWAHQGQAWIALISENLALAENRRQLQAHLRTREVTIRALRERLNGSREIDIEMEKKERELLH
jgi:hypothetical protein